MLKFIKCQVDDGSCHFSHRRRNILKLMHSNKEKELDIRDNKLGNDTNSKSLEVEEH